MLWPQFSKLTGMAAAFTVLLTATQLFAQNENFQKVRFESADGVDLHGAWYPSGRTAPVVMILHDIKSDSSRPQWNQLASALQKAGYAVLAFDFRGHGGSTVVNPQTFTPRNRLVQVAAGGTIDAKTFPRTYYPVLVNDIAAAKAFLDTKNDAGDCNSSSLILVGAGEGATLGSLWLKSEWNRYRVVVLQGPFGQPVRQVGQEPYGRNTVAAVWLSISHKFGNVSDAKILPPILAPAAAKNMPMTFVYNKNVVTDEKITDYLIKKLKNKDNPKHRYIGANGIGNAQKLTGRELLGTPGTISGIVGWLDTLKKDALFRNWAQQDFQKTQFVWRVGRQIVPASDPLGGASFRFIDFSQFLRSP